MKKIFVWIAIILILGLALILTKRYSKPIPKGSGIQQTFPTATILQDDRVELASINTLFPGFPLPADLFEYEDGPHTNAEMQPGIGIESIQFQFKTNQSIDVTANSIRTWLKSNGYSIGRDPLAEAATKYDIPPSPDNPQSISAERRHFTNNQYLSENFDINISHDWTKDKSPAHVTVTYDNNYSKK